MKKIFTVFLFLLLSVSCVNASRGIAPGNHTNFPGGFPNGVTLRNLPVLNGYPGKVFWVDSNTGAGGNGGTFNRPFATIDQAINKCTADDGDVIMVKAGHTETLDDSSDLVLDIAGITIIGLGNYDNRPVITVGDAVGETIAITGDDVAIHNIKFVPGKDALAKLLDVDASGTIINGCLFDEASSIQVEQYLNITGSGSQIIGNVFRSVAAGANNAIELAASTNTDIVIDGNLIQGDWANAGIYCASPNTELVISNNDIWNTQTGDHAIEFTVACTGTLRNNTMYTNAFATALDPGSMRCIGNKYVGTTDEGAYDIPEVGSTGTAFASTKSLADVLGHDGSTKTVATGNLIAISGESFVVTVSVTSSSIPNNTQTGGAITGGCLGYVLVEDIIIQTDATGLAAPTNIQISCDNTNGLTGATTILYEDAIADLGANKTVIVSATGTFPMVLEPSSKLYIHGDDAAGTGAGVAYMYIKCRRVIDGSNLTGNNL